MGAKIKLNAASGGGSVSIQAPSSTSNNRIINLPDENGTFITTNTGSPLQVLEQFEVPCDGTSITGSQGSISIGNVTTQQDLTTTFTDLTGSSISYQPPTGSKIVVYTFKFAGFFKDTDPITYGFIYLDDVAVSSFPFTERGGINHLRTTWSHAFRIESSLSADASIGRVQSWNSSKTIKIKVREHSGVYEAKLHNFQNASNTSGSNVTGAFVIPTIGIQAIGSLS